MPVHQFTERRKTTTGVYHRRQKRYLAGNLFALYATYEPLRVMRSLLV